MKSNNPYIFICDLETTGFSYTKNDVIELAGIIVEKKGDEYVRLNSFYGRCRPYSRDTWTTGAERIHKIPLSEALKFQHPRQMLIKFLNFLVPYKSNNNKPLLFVSHCKNKFDIKFVYHAFVKEAIHPSFCKVFNFEFTESTVDLADKYKSMTGLTDSKLPTVADYFNIKMDHHKAMADTEACFEIYKEFKKMKLGLGIFHEE